jgi:hypothetical protein
LTSRIWKEVRVLHNLVTGLASKGLCIANLAFSLKVKSRSRKQAYNPYLIRSYLIKLIAYCLDDFQISIEPFFRIWL